MDNLNENLKLKAAMREVQKVINKWDLGGFVILASENRMEHLLEVAPTWSCAKIVETPQGKRIHIRSKAKDFPSKSTQKKCNRRRNKNATEVG